MRERSSWVSPESEQALLNRSNRTEPSQSFSVDLQSLLKNAVLFSSILRSFHMNNSRSHRGLPMKLTIFERSVWRTCAMRTRSSCSLRSEEWIRVKIARNVVTGTLDIGAVIEQPDQPQFCPRSPFARKCSVSSHDIPILPCQQD